MTLKEEIEILRGEPIEVFDGEPLDVPCIETSDAERLCKNPVVSVHMITYNHEPYIRQAIEGVMMQKTDFEFELIIGEDCSQDKTREICFEYQKKYPDKIRVLWWHENVSKLGGNSKRVTARCRGEFVAFCEGDDYWTSSDKLSRQVKVLKQMSSVGMVSTGGNVVNSVGEFISAFETPCSGLVPRKTMVKKILSSFWFGVLTCAIMYRKRVLDQNLSKYGLLERVNFKCGDVQKELMILDVSDIFFLPEKMVSYRRSQTSATGSPRSNFFVGRDGILVRYIYSRIAGLLSEEDRILRWYINYMVMSGMPFLKFSTWFYWYRRSDHKFIVLVRVFLKFLKKKLNYFKNKCLV